MTKINRRLRIMLSVNTSWNLVNFRAGLIRALVEQEHDVVAATPPDAYSSKLAGLGCRFIPFPMDNDGVSPVNDANLIGRYWRLLRSERPDVFLGFTIKPNVYGSFAAHTHGIPVINNVSGLGTAFISKRWLAAVAKVLYRRAFRRSAIVFFQNADDRDLFVGGGLVRKDQTSLLPGSGIDLSRFNLAKPINTPDTDDSDFKFLLASRLLWDKGVGEFVEAAKAVRNRAPRVRFQLLGFLDAKNRSAIDAAIIKGWVDDGVVEYLGAADDVRPYLRAADCVVLPSYREGTPRSLLEAAAMGKPIIATDVPGCREVVECGANGLLCAPRSADDLARCMLEVLALSAEARRRMGLAGREKVVRNFDEAIVIGQYMNAIAVATAPTVNEGRPRARAAYFG